ncbi:hypothetical protein C5S32_11485 [ANME-1 cluster archaeon GoMg1]|nr:hypothetical protein [ANME-1 cluster archaeon GoMg1]
MYPEEYRSTLSGLIDANEDLKTLLGLFYQLKGYTTDETLVKNFRAMTGKEEDDCEGLLKLLRKKSIIKIGAYDEYLCLSGYEAIFDRFAAECSPQPGDLVDYIDKAVEEGEKAKLKMIELLLKMGKHGAGGFTQYASIKMVIAEMFSPAVFQSLENEFIAHNLCVYGKRQTTEFLALYQNQSEDRIEEAKEKLKEWKTNKLTEPLRETVEKEITELVEGARTRMVREKRKEKLAETLSIPGSEMIGDTFGYFSGFSTDDSFLFSTCNALVEHDSLYIVVTDSLSVYEATEWKNFPVVFITEHIPKWIDKSKFEAVFKDAYPKLSERKIAIAVPNEVAYTNYKQGLLLELVNRLGIRKVWEL